MIKSLLREPLFHFLILGATLFAVWAINNPDPEATEPDKPQVVITESRIDSLIDIWTKTRQRPPTQEELRALIEDYLKEEIFYREALAMGLDKDDTIVRRRLRQKMELFVEDFASAAQPSDEQLEEFLKSHAKQFRVDRKVSLRQIYLNPDKRSETLEQDVKELLTKLDETSTSEDYGDPFLLPTAFEKTPLTQLTQNFGGDFGSEVFAQKSGEWSGPIPSSFGVHLVFVDEKEAGRLPLLEEIHSVVEREWFANKRFEAKREFFEKLRERYEVIVESIEKTPLSAELSP